jgi:signal transduction histidine kinase
MVAGLVSLTGVGVMLDVRARLHRELVASLETRGIALARDVAARSANLILTEDPFGLYRLVRDTQANNPDVRYAYVVDGDGRVLVHTFILRVPPGLLSIDRVAEKDTHRVQVLATEEGLVTDVGTPVLAGRAGTVHVGLSQRRLAASVSRATWAIAGMMLAALLGGFAVALVLTYILTRPVVELVGVARAVGRGDLSARATRLSDDEIGELALAFNAMNENLASSKADLLRRMRELEALNAIAMAISGSLDLDELLEGAIRKVLDIMPFRAGWVLLGGTSQPLRLAAQEGLPPGFSIDPGRVECVCGNRLAEPRPAVIDNVAGQCPCASAWLLATAGLPCHICVPLIAGERVVGVLNLASDHRRAFTGDDLTLLGSIGRQVGVAVENARLWNEVRQGEALRGQLLSKVIEAQEAERKRIARELHDGAGQSLTALLLGLRTLDQQPALPDSSRPHLANLRTLTKGLFDDLHRLAVELGPHALDQLGLVGAVESCLRDVGQQLGLDVDFAATGFDGLPIPGEVETAVYRVAQEAFTNVAKHAAASRLSVMLERRADTIVLVVDDDGCGFDVDGVTTPCSTAEPAHLGLFGMRERAALLNGRLTIESERGRGTTVFVEIPIPNSHDSNPARR